MILTVHQPDFLPWGGFWARAAMSDRLVLISGVEYSKGDTTNRVKMDGTWCTLPLLNKGLQRDLQFDLQVLPRVVARLRQTYMSKKNKYGERLEPLIKILQSVTDPSLVNLNTQLILATAKILGLKTQIVEDRDDWVGLSKATRLLHVIERNTVAELDIQYLAGRGAREYLSPEFPVDVMIDEGQYPDESVLQLIANEESPRESLTVGRTVLAPL